MGKHIAKVGFFEPGLVKAADFAKFEPYQRSEFCLLATEAGIGHHQLAEMMAVPVHEVITATQLRHAHYPFDRDVAQTGGIRRPETASMKTKIKLLSFIADAPDGTITISLNNMMKATRTRRPSLIAALKLFREKGYVSVSRDGAGAVPSVFRLTLKGEAALSRWKEAA